MEGISVAIDRLPGTKSEIERLDNARAMTGGFHKAPSSCRVTA
jgi:hypothetical protein